MKEHIEEMTKVLIDYTKKNHIMASHVILEDYAEQLYNAGYRKQIDGEWEARTDVVGFVRCSVCKDFNVYDEWADGKKWNFCPHCGAKMKGGAE